MCIWLLAGVMLLTETLSHAYVLTLLSRIKCKWIHVQLHTDFQGHIGRSNPCSNGSWDSEHSSPTWTYQCAGYRSLGTRWWECWQSCSLYQAWGHLGVCYGKFLQRLWQCSLVTENPMEFCLCWAGKQVRQCSYQHPNDMLYPVVGRE
jgi:hypothetical protein